MGLRLRDNNIARLIREHKSRVLMEIGICRCRNSRSMIKAASRAWPVEDVVYYGFDVFADYSTDGNKAIWRKEMSAVPWSLEHVSRELNKTGAKIYLYQGLTAATIPLFALAHHCPIDFIWLDGGHSLPTVTCDWELVQILMTPETVVLFDDYAVHTAKDNEWPVSVIVDSIDRTKYTVEHLEPYDDNVITQRSKEIRQMCVVKVMLK